MAGQLVLPVFVAILIMVGASAPAWAAQLDVVINPNTESSPFHITHQKTVFIEYPEDGQIFDYLSGQEWVVEGTADSSSPDTQDLIRQLNQNIFDSGSQAFITDLEVSYDIHLQPFGDHTSIDYTVVLEGTISNYLITRDSQQALIDLGWRGLSAHDPVVIDGVEINLPFSILESHSTHPRRTDFLQEPQQTTSLQDPLSMPISYWNCPLSTGTFCLIPRESALMPKRLA